MKDPCGRRRQMFSGIAEYEFEIEHIEEQNNVVANVLSRLGFGKSNRDADPITSVLNIAQRSISLQESHKTQLPDGMI